MKHFENIDITSPGKSFSVPEESVDDSDIEILDKDPFDNGNVDIGPSPSSQSENTSPPPKDLPDDKGINMLVEAAYSAEDSQFVFESIPLKIPNVWAQYENHTRKRTHSEAELDIPDTAEQQESEPEVQPGPAVNEQPAIASVEQPVAPSLGQMAMMEVQPAANVVEQPAAEIVEQQPLANIEVQPQPAAEFQPMLETNEQPQPSLGVDAKKSGEPPRKRSKIGVAWGVACFLAGSVGTVATLASLPDGYFA
jgi:hypothetical protein